MASAPAVTLACVRAAAQRIAGHVNVTPVLTCPELDAATGHKVFMKCENMQRTGSFKMRGAASAAFDLPEDIAAKGLVCHSSGNHGAAVAAAARARGVPAVVVVPSTTAQVKIDNIKALGGRVVVCEPTQQARTATALAEAAAMGGATFIHPYNQAEVVAGQGTIALELLEQVPDLDAILVPTSGGGMLTGIAVATRGLAPKCTVHAVEPRGKRLGEAFAEGRRVVDPETANSALPTICDAMPTRCLGELPWSLAHEGGLVDHRVYTVGDDDVIRAMRFCFETLKVVVEPTAAAGIAALLGRQVPGEGRRIGVILCGGNVDLGGRLPWQAAAAGHEENGEGASKRNRTS